MQNRMFASSWAYLQTFGDGELMGDVCIGAGHPGSRVKSFAVSSNGNVGVTVLFDSTISVWDLKTMQVRSLALYLLLGPHHLTTSRHGF